MCLSWGVGRWNTLLGTSVYTAAQRDCLTRVTNTSSPNHHPNPSAVLAVGTPNSCLFSSGRLHPHPRVLGEPELPGAPRNTRLLRGRARIQTRPSAPRNVP